MPEPIENREQPNRLLPVKSLFYQLYCLWAKIETVFSVAVFAALILFVVVSSFAAIKLSGYSGEPERYLPFVGLIALSITFGLWFIACFTGDPNQSNRCRQSFRFAYVFTMTTFVVIIFPMANPWQPDIFGPISLIRGCVNAQADMPVPASIRCGTTDLLAVGAADNAKRTPDGSASNAAQTAVPAAGTLSERDGADAAVVPMDTANVSATGPQRRYARQPGYTYRSSYPWLVVVGGTYGTAAGVEDANPKAPASKHSYQIVEGGFVLPFYVVLLALIGAAISLTRRIPEYQKRASSGYVGTVDEPPLDSRTVREAVIFQIMQLITAPFIAMVAYYAIAPNGVASGIALAFISGFSSELVLLQIRGVVQGLHPKSSTKLAATSINPLGSISGTVVTADGHPVPNAVVVIGQGVLKTTSREDGSFTFIAVPAGEYQIVATEGDRSGSMRSCVPERNVVIGHIRIE